MTQFAVDVIQWKRLIDLRERVFTAIKECLEVDGHCKSYEGRFDIRYSLPNYFQDEGGEPDWSIHFACYLIGPSRGEDWYGSSFKEVVDKVERDINVWLGWHDEWLVRYKKELSDCGGKRNE